MTSNPRSEREFDPVGLARELLRATRSGALATLQVSGEGSGEAAGGPFASLVSVATDLDGAPLFLVSRLSGHTTNLDADDRASLLLARPGRGDPLAHPRLTLVGRVRQNDDPRVRRRFLARHPKAALYADFADFSFRRMEIERAHLNGGFARAATLEAAEILTDLTGAGSLAEAAEGAAEHMNADHADALRLYATVLARAPDASWQVSGLDPDGLDLMAGDLTARVAFPERVVDPGALRALLVRLAALAREGRTADTAAGAEPPDDGSA